MVSILRLEEEAKQGLRYNFCVISAVSVYNRYASAVNEQREN
jgi:hypothetical protein